MTKKNIIIVVVVLAAIALGAIYFYNQPKSSQNYQAPASSYNPQTQGKVIFGVKDAATSMGTISSVVITVNKVEIHNEAQGWVTLSTQSNQYDLLALKQSGLTSLLVQTNVQAGTYDQMRLTVSGVVVTQNGVQQQAKLPSGELKIVGKIVVDAGKTSSAVFDFATDKSLHLTGNGKFIFAPVIKLQTESETDATVDSNDDVHISKGHMDSDENEGMDVDGEMKENFKLDLNTKLDLVDDAVKVDETGDTSSSIKITADAAINLAVANGSIDSAISVKLVTKDDKQEWLVTGLKNLVLTNVYVDATTGAVINSNE